MNKSLPGIVLESSYERHLLSKSAVEPVVLSQLPPGTTAAHVAQSLLGEAEHGNVYLKPIDLEIGHRGEDFLVSLGEILDFDDYENATTAYELVHSNTDSLRYPFTVIAQFPVKSSLDTNREISAICRELALLTKDLPGPLRFILLLSFDAGVPDDSIAQMDWEPLHPYPCPLSFVGNPGSLILDGYDTYVSMRFFWEVAGSHELLNRCQEFHGTTRGYLERSNTDELINRQLEREFPLDIARTKALYSVFMDCLSTEEKARVLKSGILELNSIPNAQRLKSRGLFWHPPGRLHLHITVDGARLLSCDDRFINQYARGINGRESLVEIARANPLVGSWLMGLLSLIELEILAAVKASGKSVSIADRLGYTEELNRLARVSQRNAALGNISCLESIDFAGFHHLVEIATHSDIRGCVPLSRERLNDVRIVRNMVAHMNPVSWQAVKIVLNSLETLCRK